MPDAPLLPQITPPDYSESKMENIPLGSLNTTGENILDGALLKVRRITIKGQIDGE